MPASLAISSVEAPCSPRSAKTAMATSRISSRRSSFVFRSALITGTRLVMTHNLVKSLRHPVEVRLREPRVEGQRQGALEDAGRAGEAPLPGIGAEEVQRVGADLHLDPLRPQVGEDPVAIVDLDHVGLPAVDVAVIR